MERVFCHNYGLVVSHRSTLKWNVSFVTTMALSYQKGIYHTDKDKAIV
jgi:hypothetical protein